MHGRGTPVIAGTKHVPRHNFGGNNDKDVAAAAASWGGGIDNDQDFGELEVRRGVQVDCVCV